MKMFFLKIGTVACIAVLMNSCTIEKKIYPKGYSISWNKKNDKSIANEQELKIAENHVEKTNNDEIVEYTLDIENDNISIDNSSDFVSTSIEQPKANRIEQNIISSEANIIETNNTNSQIKNNKIKQVIRKHTTQTSSSKSLGNDEILGLILCLLGLAPFGVLVAKGKGSKFKTNLLLWLGGFACVIIGVIIALGGSYLGVVFSLLGSLLFLSSFIHGILSILR
jgi:hypothetical protein